MCIFCVVWNIAVGGLRGASELQADVRIPSLPSCYSEHYHNMLTERNVEYYHSRSLNNRWTASE